MLEHIFCCFPCYDKQKNKEHVAEGQRPIELESVYSQRVDMRERIEDFYKDIYQKMHDKIQHVEGENNQLKNLHKEELERKEQEHQTKLADIHEKLTEKDRTLTEFKAHDEKQNEKYKKEEEAMKHRKENWLDISRDFDSLVGKITNATGNLKASFNPEKRPIEDIITFFQQCWTEDIGYDSKRREDTIRKVNELFKGKTLKNSYPIVTVLVEKLLSDFLVTRIYLAPTHMAFGDANEAYQYLEDLLQDDNTDFLKHLRIKMVGYLAERAEKDDEYKKAITGAISNLVKEIVDRLSTIYKKEKLEKQVKKVVAFAFKLSFPIRGQRNHIVIHNLEADGPLYTNQVDQHALSSNHNSNKVFLGIYPVIYSVANANGRKVDIEHKENEKEDHDEDDDDDSDNDDESDDDDSDDSDDSSTPKKITRKGKKKKEEKIKNPGSYLNEDFVFRGTAIGYEQR